MKSEVFIRCLVILIASCAVSVAQPQQADPILARAVGITAPIEIRVSAVRRYLKAHPQVTPQAAVQNLVDFFALGQMASKQGLQHRPSFKDEQVKLLAMTYLRQIFEPKWSVEAVPEADRRRVFEINLLKFQHPRICNPDHILIGHRPDKRMELPTDPQQAAAARRLANALHKKLVSKPPANQKAFLDAYVSMQGEVTAANLQIKSEKIGWFALEEGPLSRNMDSEFARQTFALKADEISRPFSTKFGWHIIRQFKCEDAKHETYDEARVSIAKRILGDVRKRELGVLTRSLADAYDPVSDGAGLRRLIRLEPLLRSEEKRSLPSLQK